jgi:hypothetical protein
MYEFVQLCVETNLIPFPPASGWCTALSHMHHYKINKNRAVNHKIGVVQC